MNYYFLKIGKGNSEALDWLEGNNTLQRPAAVIYFDNLTETDYQNGKGATQPREFWKRGSSALLRKQTRMVVVSNGEVWILEPAGKVTFLPEIEKDSFKLTPKAMPVKILTRRSMKDVPPVLAGIGVNQFYARGTFRPINHWGNFKAIDWTTKASFDAEHWDIDQQGPVQLLECLGSVEFETLIAKIFESFGCYVPAYHGGLIQDVDLFVHNDSDKELRIGELVIPKEKSVSVQVKTWSNNMRKPNSVDYLIGFDVKGLNAFDAEWVIKQVIASPSVTAWLQRSLQWLPSSYFEKIGFNTRNISFPTDCIGAGG